MYLASHELRRTAKLSPHEEEIHLRGMKELKMRGCWDDVQLLFPVTPRPFERRKSVPVSEHSPTTVPVATSVAYKPIVMGLAGRQAES